MSRIEYRRGSSPEVLADLPDGCAAVVLTDPPFGTGTDAAAYGRPREGRINAIANDRDLSQIERVAPLLARLLAPEGVALVFCAPQRRRALENALEGNGLEPIHSLPWDKGAPGISYRVRYAYEDVVLAVHPGFDPWGAREPIISPVRFPRIQKPEHPNEKPVGLLSRYLAWACPSGGLVLDPFSGIASCGVAAAGLGLDYIGAELDPQWWPIAERRIAEALNQPHPELPQGSLFGEAA